MQHKKHPGNCQLEKLQHIICKHAEVTFTANVNQHKCKTTVYRIQCVHKTWNRCANVQHLKSVPWTSCIFHKTQIISNFLYNVILRTLQAMHSQHWQAEISPQPLDPTRAGAKAGSTVPRQTRAGCPLRALNPSRALAKPRCAPPALHSYAVLKNFFCAV